MRRFMIVVPALLTLGAGASTQQEEVRSALQTPPAVRAMTIHGVRLHMSREEGDAALRRAGFSFLRESEGSLVYTNPKGEFLTLTIGKAAVAKVTYLSQLSPDEQRVEEGRQAIIGAYGHPAYWFRWTPEGRLRDQFVYASHSDFQEMNRASQIQSCSANWACEKVRDDIDCREVLKPDLGAVLAISYVYRGAYWTLSDYSSEYVTVAADPKFQALDTSDASCPVGPVH